MTSRTTVVEQTGWRWCSKCSGLAYFGQALCPDGGVHDHSDSGDYTIHDDNSTGGQSQWRYCINCQTMSWTGLGEALCPNGLKHYTTGSLDYYLTIDEDNTAGQHEWRWCSKCQGLAWIGGGLGICQGGGTHDVSGSGNYTLTLDGNGASTGQSKWKHCKKCQLLAYDGESKCAGGGEHINADSGDYTLEYTLADNIASTKGQNNWKYCSKCEVLIFAGGSTQGACPGGGSHSHIGSGNYVIANKPLSGAQDGWSYCNKCQMLWYSANGPARCPQGSNSFHDSLGSGNYSIANSGALLPISIKGSTSSIPSTQSTSTIQTSNAPGAISSPTGTITSPADSSLPAGKSSSLGTGAIAGIAIGGVGVLLLAIGVFFFLRRRLRKGKDEYLVTPSPNNGEDYKNRAEMAAQESSGWGGFPATKDVNIVDATPTTEVESRIVPTPVEMHASRR